MTLQDIAIIRLISQRIEGYEFSTAKELVKWMGAMQAQDYAMSKWAVGLRLLSPKESEVEREIDRGEVIRTHIMRPTWHYVSAEDIYWMLELTAPQIKSSMKSRHVGLELKKETVAQGNELIESIIAKGKNVTREEIAKEFERAGIRTDDNRLAHFLILAELEGIICSGRIRDKKPTYALLSERVPNKKTLTREESLAELAKRYFTSHCPATIQDFAWWSGLNLTEARRGIESVKSDFNLKTIGDQQFWLTDSYKGTRMNSPSVHLLPAYDEFLISYKDRSASLSSTDNKKAVSVNGIFRPTIVINGQVKGLWRRTTQKGRIIIEVESFQNDDDNLQALITDQAYNYGRFLNIEIEVRFKTE